MTLRKKIGIALFSIGFFVSAFCIEMLYQSFVIHDHQVAFHERCLVLHDIDEAIKYHIKQRKMGTHILTDYKADVVAFKSYAKKLNDIVIDAKLMAGFYLAHYEDPVYEARFKKWMSSSETVVLAQRDVLSKSISVEEWEKITTEHLHKACYGFRDAIYLPSTREETLHYLISVTNPAIAYMDEALELKFDLIDKIISMAKKPTLKDIIEVQNHDAIIKLSADKIHQLRDVKDLDQQIYKDLDSLDNVLYNDYYPLRNEIVDMIEHAYKNNDFSAISNNSERWETINESCINALFKLLASLEKEEEKINVDIASGLWPILEKLILMFFIITIVFMIHRYTNKEILTSLDNALTVSHEMAKQCQVMVDTITSLSGASEQLTVSIRNISKSSESTATRSENAVSLAKTSEENFKVLEKEVSSINQSVQDIVSIAKNTDMLALNAAIEAARAGEFGKSFAVVANEVQALASKSSSTSSAITHTVHEIQERLKANLEFISKVSESNEYINSNTVELASSLEQFSSTMSEVNTGLAELTTSTESIQTEAQRVNQNIKNLLEGTKV